MKNAKSHVVRADANCSCDWEDTFRQWLTFHSDISSERNFVEYKSHTRKLQQCVSGEEEEGRSRKREREKVSSRVLDENEK
jgi:hypothetical protein